jgi:hypothetical protein
MRSVLQLVYSHPSIHAKRGRDASGGSARRRRKG